MSQINNTTAGREKFSAAIVKNFGALKFFSITIVLYGIFFSVYSSVILESDLFGQYLETYTSLASQLLNTVFGDETYLVDTVLRTKTEIRVDDGAYIRVTESCDGSTILAMLTASILAWPSKFISRIAIALTGLAFMFSINVMRIASMMLGNIYLPIYFDIINDWILPLLMICAALGYFYSWTKISGRHPSD